MDESINMIDLNVSGLVAMGLICIPHMKRGSHIINIASQASFQPLPYLNIYSATKAFVRNYTRALNVELKDKGIVATAVCPGWMKTGLFDRALIGAKKAPKNFKGMVTPDLVAKKAMMDADKGKDLSVYSLYVKTGHLVAKILPQKAMMKVWGIQQGAPGGHWKVKAMTGDFGKFIEKNEKENTASLDLSAYIMKNAKVRMALRMARDNNLGDETWQQLIDILKEEIDKK